jgi:hypothetical protein
MGLMMLNPRDLLSAVSECAHDTRVTVDALLDTIERATTCNGCTYRSLVDLGGRTKGTQGQYCMRRDEPCRQDEATRELKAWSTGKNGSGE